MDRDVKLGFSESFGLVTVCIISKMFYGFLPFEIKNYGTAVWYINAIASALVLISFLISAKYTPGKITGFLITVYFLLYSAMNIRETVRVIKIYNFLKTPEWIFAAAFLIAAIIVCKSDFFGGAKLAGLYSAIILGAFLIIFIISFKQYDFVNLAPYGGFGADKTIAGCITQMTLFSDVFLLLFLKREAGGKKSVVRCGVRAMVVSAIITVVSAVSYICVFDYSVSSGKSSGIIEVVKNIYYGHIFQRMESLFFLVMIIASAASVCVWLFGCSHIYSGVFGIKDKKETVIPMAVIMFVLVMSKWDRVFTVTGRYGGIFLALVSLCSCVYGRVRRRI